MRLTTPLPVLALALAAVSASCSEEEVIPLQILAFTASDDNVDAGQTVTLSWSVEGADAVAVRQSPGRAIVSGGGAAGEIVSDPLNLATTFTLTATSAEGEVQTQSVNVTVTGVNIVSFEASPASIGRGGTATLSWRLGGSPPSEVLLVDSNGDNVIQPSTDRTGSTTVMPESTETYTLRAQAGGVRAERMATVTVMSMPPTIETFEAVAIVNGSPQVVTTVAQGSEIQLRWRVSNVEEVQVTDNGNIRRPWNATGAMSGNVTVRADLERNVYLLEARNGPNPDDLQMQELVVMTAERPSIDSFSVSPTSYATSSTIATATWSTTGAVGTILLIDGQMAPNFPRSTSGSYMFDVTGEANVTLIARNAVGDTTATQMITLGYDDAEPNDSTATAIPLSGDGLPIRGTIEAMGADFYAVMVPEGAGIFARVDPPAGGSCAALDPTLTLFDAMGNELGRRSQAGATRCAEILPPEYAGFAEDLSAGMYFLRVTQEAGASEMRYSLDVEVYELGPPLPNVMTTRVGNPEWTVTDFVQASVPWGRAADMFPELNANLAAIFGTRHMPAGPNPLTTIGRPSISSVHDYETELRTMFEVLGYTTKTTFSASEWQEPNGVLVGYTLVPAETATTGTSRDFPVAPGGPVIPDSVFPITITAVLSINGMEVGALPGAPAVTRDPPLDGLSHVSVVHAIGAAVFTMPPPLPANVTWAIELRDRTSAGWDIALPTTVNP